MAAPQAPLLGKHRIKCKTSQGIQSICELHCDSASSGRKTIDERKSMLFRHSPPQEMVHYKRAAGDVNAKQRTTGDGKTQNSAPQAPEIMKSAAVAGANHGFGRRGWS
eukprot:gene10489-biopygen4776